MKIDRRLILALLSSFILVSGCRLLRDLQTDLASQPAKPTHIGRKVIGNVTEIIREQLKTAEFAKFALESGLVTRMTAKNLCSCIHVAALQSRDTQGGNVLTALADSRRLCQSHTSSYGSDVFLEPRYIDAPQGKPAPVVTGDGRSFVARSGHYILVEGRFTGQVARLIGTRSEYLNPPAVARFDPEKPHLGCQLLDEVTKVSADELRELSEPTEE